MDAAESFVYKKHMPGRETSRYGAAEPSRESADYHDPHIRLLFCNSLQLQSWPVADGRAPYWRCYHNDICGAAVVVDGRRVPLLPEALYLIPPNTTFRSELSRSVNHLYIHFRAEPPYHAAASGCHSVALGSDARQLIDTLRNFLLGDPSGSPHFGLAVRALVSLALCRLPDEVLADKQPDPRINEAMQWLLQRPEQRVDNAQLAAQAGMNINAFIRRFRQEVGATPQAFARYHRVELAARLLRRSGLSLDAIAEMAGFCDRYHLSRVFRQLRGIAPASFRRENAEQT